MHGWHACALAAKGGVKPAAMHICHSHRFKCFQHQFHTPCSGRRGSFAIKQCKLSPPDPCLKVYLARDTSRLDPLVQEYEVALRALTDLLDHYAALRRRSKTVKPRTVGGWVGRWAGW